MECRDLPQAIWLDHDCPREQLLSRLELLGQAAGGWILLARCRGCGQAWRVDLPDKYSVDLALQVPGSDPTAWSAEQDRAVRLEYLRRSHGGEGEEPCAWAGCPLPVLRGLAVCAEHAYQAGMRARMAGPGLEEG